MTKKLNNDTKGLMIMELGVFELRGLARKLGISSPTTKKRDELISLILEKLENGDIIDTSGKRKGRPYKTLSSIESIYANVVTQFANQDSNNDYSYDSLIRMNQDIVDIDLNDGLKEEEIKTSGILRDAETIYQFYDIEKGICVFIDKNCTNSSLLKIGDKVEVVAKKINSSNQYLSVSIESINDISIKEYDPVEFETGKEIISSQEIPFLYGYAKEGRRNIYCSVKDLYENDDLQKLYEYCNQNNIHLLILGTNISFENNLYLNDFDCDKFVTPYGSSNDFNFNQVIDCINYAQNLLQSGKKVLLFVVDIIDVMRALDKCFVPDMNDAEHAHQTIIITQKLLSLGHVFDSGNSLTLILRYNNIDENDKFLQTDILKISKRI